MKTILVILVVGIAVVGGGIYFYKQSATPVAPIQTATDNSNPEGKTQTPTQFIQNTPDLTALKAEGSIYKDPKGVFTLLYPSDYTVDSQGDGQYARFFKRGATQTGQTEIYDGVLLVIESVDLKGKTLSTWVDTQIEEVTANGNANVTQQKSATTLIKYPGYTYAVDGFGSAVYLVVQQRPQSTNAVSITFSVNDPQNKNYQAEVDAILSTLELLK